MEKMKEQVRELYRLSYLAEFIKKNKNEDLEELQKYAKEELLTCCLKLETELNKFKEKL